MRVRTLIYCLPIFSVAFLTACGRDSETAPRHNRSLDGTTHGLPTAVAVVDRGILQDPRSYTPASTGGGPKGPAVAGDEKAQVQAFADSLIKASTDGEAQVILDAFDPAQIAALKEQESVIYETFDRQRGLEAALSEEVLTQLKELERQASAAAIAIEVQDADHATITPNTILAGILGPKTPPTMNVARTGGLWKISLPAPLTADDAALIVAFHKRLQAAIESLTEQVSSGKLKTLPEILMGIQQALTGQAPAPTPAGSGEAGSGDTAVPPAVSDGDPPVKAPDEPVAPPPEGTGDQPPEGRRSPRKP